MYNELVSDPFCLRFEIKPATVVTPPTVIPFAEAVRCATEIYRFSFSVSTRILPKLGLLEAIPSREHFCQEG